MATPCHACHGYPGEDPAFLCLACKGTGTEQGEPCPLCHAITLGGMHRTVVARCSCGWVRHGRQALAQARRHRAVTRGTITNLVRPHA